MAVTIGSNDSISCRGTFDVSQGTVIFKDEQILRNYLEQREETPIAIPVENWKVHDNLASFLPTTASSDDLGRILGTFGTSSPILQTSDSKATSITQYARFRYIITDNYDLGQTIILRLNSGMNTTVSDGTATLDVQVYVDNGAGGVGSDICSTAAQSINSLSKSDKDFNLTPTSLAAGDIIDIRISISITDTSTATAVIGEISKIELVRDIRG